MTTSCGRLFDGVASLLGIGDFNSYEGELPSRLQAEAENAQPQRQPYPYALEKRRPVGPEHAAGRGSPAGRQKARGEKARRFHLTLANALLDMAIRLTHAGGIRKAALSGGVFQNNCC